MLLPMKGRFTNDIDQSESKEKIMNLRILLPILATVIAMFALAENLVMSRVLLSGSDSAFIVPHHHMKHW